MLDVMARNAGIRGYDITQSNTIYLPNVRRFYYQDDKLIEHKNFALRNNTLTKIIEERKFKSVILAGAFASHYNGNELRLNGGKESSLAFEIGFEEAIENIKQSGASVYILNDSPDLNQVKHDCGMSNLRFNTNYQCLFSVHEHVEKFNKWNKFLQVLRKKYPDILIIDPIQIICDQNYCYSELEGTPLYRDSGHLNHMGSELVGKLYIERLGNPLAPLRSNDFPKNL